MSKVYVLYLDSGSYEDYSSNPLKVYASEDRATAQEKNINDMLALYIPQFQELWAAKGNEAHAALHSNESHIEARKELDKVIKKHDPGIEALVEEFISKVGEEFRRDFEGLKYGSNDKRACYATCEFEE